MAVALNTPLTLTLVRYTFREGDNVRELLDFCSMPRNVVSPEDIVDYLLDRVLPAAYTQRPGHPSLIYDLQTAQNALYHIAVQMNQDGTRDLRWWHIPRRAPRKLRELMSGMMVGLLFGIVAGTAVGVGIGAGFFAGFMFGPWFPFRPEDRDPRRMGSIRWGVILRKEGLSIGTGVGSGVAIITGLACSVIAGYRSGIEIGIETGLIAGAVLGLVTGFMFTVMGGLAESGVGQTSSATPLSSWRNDRKYWLVFGTGIGLAFGFAVGIMLWVAAGFVTGIVSGVVIGVGIGVIASVAVPESWSAALAFLQLSVRWRTPLRFMRLLEDARQRSVLRTIGPVYQFRHARLQDRLAQRGDNGGSKSLMK